jgi:hypothetical protein
MRGAKIRRFAGSLCLGPATRRRIDPYGAGEKSQRGGPSPVLGSNSKGLKPMKLLSVTAALTLAAFSVSASAQDAGYANWGSCINVWVKLNMPNSKNGGGQKTVNTAVAGSNVQYE